MIFQDVLEHFNIPHQTSGIYCRPGWINFNCPFCGTDVKNPNKPYMGYNKAGRYCHCWRCGPRNPLAVIEQITGTPQHQLRLMFGELASEGLPEQHKPKGKLLIPAGVGELEECHKKYLKGRGFTLTHILPLWGIKGIGIAARLSWRLFIPIHDANGSMVSWTTRSISDLVHSRYISAAEDQEAVPHKELLYGEHYCRNAVVVCEGPLDAWRIGPGAVAVMGVQYTPAQILAISKYPTRVICFDNERQAQHRARRLAAMLADFEGDTCNVVLSAKDPGSADVKEIKQIRKEFLE